MNQIDQMTQQNSALVEQSTAAADSLREQAMKLTQVVALFRVNGSTASAPRAAPAPSLARAPAPRPAVGLAKARTATAPAALRKPAASKAQTALPPTASTSKPAKDDAGDWENF